METFATFAIAALLAYTVNATPCTDICNAQCTMQKKTCVFSGIPDNLCGTVNGVCTMACAAACVCVDSCAAECGDEPSKCKGDDSAAVPHGDLNVLSCGINVSVCSSSCQMKCNFNLFAGVVNAVTGAGGAGGTDGQSVTQ
ncbi:hypothetical protein RRG08_065892 [Elysia crispata]|uniref:Uncharacterized protein n=1 Tax=Elysia crispata TaxID=231223 RepID=A0AAE0YYE1_9GAST|nr:hypothetical protein RRG08_065892 [Elysia crispata]